MGKGDLKTKRGKIFRGTHGTRRLRKKKRKKTSQSLNKSAEHPYGS